MTSDIKKTPAGPSLERMRAALRSMGKDLRLGGRDLYGDVRRFAGSTRKHTVKLATALRGDVRRLAKAAAPPKPPAQRKPRAARKAPPAAPRERAKHA